MTEDATIDETTTAAPRGRAAGNASQKSGGDPLAALRARIGQVGRRRRLLRRVSAMARIAVSVLLAAAVLFLVDWTFAPSRLARLLMLLVAAAAVGRVYWRRVRPLLAVRETEADIAVLVEKQHGIDSDLVAALEFAGRDAAAGSADLRDAVVDYVAEFGRSWQMPREPVDPKLRRRLAWLAVASAIAATAVVVRPDFAAAFANRMFLGVAHYPTRTRIESLRIGGRQVDPTPGAAAGLACPLGRPLPFVVGIGGETPRLARLRLESVKSGDATEIELVADAPALGDAAGPDAAGAVPPGNSAATNYTARLPKLTEPIDVQVFAGDAWTEPMRVGAIQPPLVDVTLSATPPAYATGRVERSPRGARQVTVLEGSRVDIDLRCTNKKLASAAVVIDGVEHPLRPRSAEGGAGAAAEWELPAENSPLARLDHMVAYEIHIVDEDGLSVDTPLVGAIRVKPDAPPRVTADVQTRLVLPAAAPRLAWRVADDHGLARLELVIEPLRVAGESRSGEFDGGSQTASRPVRELTLPITLPEAGRAGWVAADRLPLEGVETVKLSGLGLVPGDRVKLVVRAVDYRGESAGQVVDSDPVLLDVTDESGILAALTDSDEKAVQQIDAIIERELSVGGTP